MLRLNTHPINFQKKITSTLTLLIVFIVKLYAQEKNCSQLLTGKVIDKHNNEALAFAKLYEFSSEQGVETDINGNFILQHLCVNKQLSIRVEHPDCKSQIIQLIIQHDTSITILLEHHDHLLKAVEINESYSPISNTQNYQQLTELELLETKGLLLGETLKKISGVTSLNTGTSIAKPMIHGLHSNRIIILNNGVRLEGQQWGNEHAPEIDPFLAGDITVIKGAMGVRYGSDAIGGVIMINPKPLPDTGMLKGEINSVLQSNGRSVTTSGMLNGKINKLWNLQYRVQGTYKKQGNQHTPTYTIDNTGLTENNFSYHLKLDRKLIKSELFYSQFNTQLGIYSGSHIGNLKDLQNVINGNNPPQNAPFTYTINRPYQQITHELIKFKTQIFINHYNNIQLNYARQYNDRSEYDKVLRSRESNKPELNFTITTHLSEAIFNNHTDNGIVSNIGIFGMHQANTYEGRFFIPNFLSNNVAGFIIEKYIKPTYSLETGLRYDYKTIQTFYYDSNNNLQKPFKQFSNLSYNISGYYQLNKTISATLALASAWRAPGVNELYSKGVHHGLASFEMGNVNLQTEKVYTSTLDINFSFKNLTIQNESYYNYFINYIYLKPTLTPVLTIRGAFPGFIYDQCKAYFTGNDLTLQWHITNWLSFNHKQMFIYALNLTNHTDLPFIPANRFNSSILFNYELKQLHPTASIEFFAENKQKHYTEGSDYLPPPPAYQLINLSVGTTKLFGNKNIAVLVGIQNLLNKSYRSYTNRFRYYIDELGRNYTLRIQYKF